jgi:hypothetical protein
MQMLERMASGKPPETTPKMPAVQSGPLDVSGPLDLRSTTGPLHESGNERVIRRLQMIGTRAEEIANGLLDLAMQCIQAGDASASAAKETEKLNGAVEPPKAPSLIKRPVSRTPKIGR